MTNTLNYTQMVANILGADPNENTVMTASMKKVINECAKNLDTKTPNEAIAIATTAFDRLIEDYNKALYLIPYYPICDIADKWIPVENSPLLGKQFRIDADGTYVDIEVLERHSDTVDGTPGCVYRINGNTKLAIMLSGNNIIEYESDAKTETPEDMKLSNSYSCACFIKSFPFTVPYPTVTTIIHDKNENGEVTDYGFISDIRNNSREEVSAEELHGHFYSPIGTSLYPELTAEELTAIGHKPE